jgi:hypothetical protein
MDEATNDHEAGPSGHDKEKKHANEWKKGRKINLHDKVRLTAAQQMVAESGFPKKDKGGGGGGGSGSAAGGGGGGR